MDATQRYEGVSIHPSTRMSPKDTTLTERGKLLLVANGPAVVQGPEVRRGPAAKGRGLPSAVDVLGPECGGGSRDGHVRQH